MYSWGCCHQPLQPQPQYASCWFRLSVVEEWLWRLGNIATFVNASYVFTSVNVIATTDRWQYYYYPIILAWDRLSVTGYYYTQTLSQIILNLCQFFFRAVSGFWVNLWIIKDGACNQQVSLFADGTLRCHQLVMLEGCRDRLQMTSLSTHLLAACLSVNWGKLNPCK